MTQGKKFFKFHLESSFCFLDNQISTFQIFKCHDVIKCISKKHETPLTELLESNNGNEIWPVYVILQKEIFFQ